MVRGVMFLMLQVVDYAYMASLLVFESGIKMLIKFVKFAFSGGQLPLILLLLQYCLHPVQMAQQLV